MFKNILMAAAVAGTFAVTAQAAEAKVNVTIGIGEPGGYCYYNYDPYRCGGYGYYPRPGYFVPHPVFRDKVSCGAAEWKLRNQGYKQIHATNCSGKSYTFFARKNGVKFKIRFDAYRNRISDRQPI